MEPSASAAARRATGRLNERGRDGPSTMANVDDAPVRLCAGAASADLPTKADAVESIHDRRRRRPPFLSVDVGPAPSIQETAPTIEASSHNDAKEKRLTGHDAPNAWSGGAEQTGGARTGVQDEEVARGGKRRQEVAEGARGHTRRIATLGPLTVIATTTARSARDCASVADVSLFMLVVLACPADRVAHRQSVRCVDRTAPPQRDTCAGCSRSGIRWLRAAGGASFATQATSRRPSRGFYSCTRA